MLLRLAAMTASVFVAVGTASPALADPAPPGAARPSRLPRRWCPRRTSHHRRPRTTARCRPSVPGIASTPDGRTLTVVAKDETQLPVAPLTTSLSSRDWLVGATFTGTTTGSVSGGSLETGYQIGCGVEMDKIKLNGSIGATLGNGSLGTAGVSLPAQHLVPDPGPDRGRAPTRHDH